MSALMPGDTFWIAVQGVGKVGGVCKSVLPAVPTGSIRIERDEGPTLWCYPSEVHIVEPAT
jgi:hypothetical protein